MSSTSSRNRFRKARRFAAPLALSALVLAAGGALLSRLPAAAAEQAFVIPAPAVDQKGGNGLETALVAGGCFWGVQGVFQRVEGVVNAVSGYAGGSADTATYDAVSSGRTGHAETVAITYDPNVVSYGEILQVFFSVAHDPTQLNRQGPDIGSQYRSALFPTTAGQAKIAESYVDQLGKTGIYGSEIVTEIGAAAKFHPAEDYHQDFLVRNPTHPYIVINDQPKIDNLKRIFPERFRDAPVLVGDARS